MDTFPSYSVLMSVYKKEKPRYLKESIESILNQTAKPDEFVIVKDGPLTEELEAVLEEYLQKHPALFKLIPLEENKGLGPALAVGVMECRNQLIARMDSDDISDPKRCETQLAKFGELPLLDMVGCFESEFTDSIQDIVSVHKVPETQNEIARFMKRRNAVLHPTVIYRKSAVLACGNYRSVPFFEDYDLFARMIQNNAQCYNIQKPLYNLRINKDFYKRRGGIRYMKTEIAFKADRYKKGEITLKDFVISAGSHAVVCLLPNRLRSFIYLKLLRK